MADNALLI